jgi:thiol-disulfide isomerase/thioredoxin
MNWNFTRIIISAIVLPILIGLAGAAGQPSVRADLRTTHDRKLAPEFILNDSVGRSAAIDSYRGKVVLLDFWATWCHGCKKEIPWFIEFEKMYSSKGFAVVGVSMDEGGWPVLKPFLASAKVSYRSLLGNGSTARQYAITELPDSFLIDRQGRIAAIYRGLVDRDNLEANIKILLRDR